jgi:sarcosine oxidase subunit gamma
MPDARIAGGRQLPLRAQLKPGRYGAEHADGPGVELTVKHPLSIATLIARKGKAEELSRRLAERFGTALPPARRMSDGKDVTVAWSGPDQYYVTGATFREGELHRRLVAELQGLASVSDQSHGRVVIGVSGRKARQLLNKGSPVDFHPRVFPVGATAATQMAHAGVFVVKLGEDAFELSLFRGFSESFWEWLTEQAQEFGYTVV